jgi:hypothetical protein
LNPRSNKKPRDWRTRKDTFERVWDEIKLKLELNPEQTAKALLNGLIVKYPSEFKLGHLRTLQRRVLLLATVPTGSRSEVKNNYATT